MSEKEAIDSFYDEKASVSTVFKKLKNTVISKLDLFSYFVSNSNILFKLMLFILITSFSISVVCITAVPFIREYAKYRKMELSTVPPTTKAANEQVIKMLNDCKGVVRSQITIIDNPDGTQEVQRTSDCENDFRWLDGMR